MQGKMERSNLVCLPVVKELLTTENYKAWRVWIRNYLLGQDLWDVVENLAVSSNPVSRRKNSVALHAIQMSCGLEALSIIMDIPLAKLAWDALTNKYMIPMRSSISEIAPGGTSNNSISGEHYVPLRKAVQGGDWKAASEFLKAHPEGMTARITDVQGTALQSAVLLGHLHIVEELVKLMSEQDMELKDTGGYTALAIAARIGITEIAECLVNKNKKLVLIPDRFNFIPLTVAVISCNLKMARYLYSVTPLEALAPERGCHGATLLNQCLISNSDILDLTLDLLQRYPKIAITPDNQGFYPLSVLADKSSLFPSGSDLLFWQRWIYNWIQIVPASVTKDIRINITESNAGESNSKISKIPGIKRIYQLKWTHVLSLELLRLACNEIAMLNNGIQLSKARVYSSILHAAEKGIPEFIIGAVKSNPDVLWSCDDFYRNFLYYAVKFRQAKVFSLIYGLLSKDVVVSALDSYGGNLLHMAGILDPSAQLDRISGPALQMQRELQWFKEVEHIMKPAALELRNKDGMTARELFTKNHKDLVKEGERWMKENASSCTVVGALIVTIMFAAAFTVPGGNDQNTGYPMFQNHKLFKLFIISDGVSLFSSTTSVLMFLGILTSRYAEDDFLKSLPTKLMIGLSMLFISIAAMMITFSAAISVMFPGRLWIVIPVILFASVPVSLFVWLQFPLLVEIYLSTYGSGIFDRNVQHWP